MGTLCAPSESQKIDYFLQLQQRSLSRNSIMRVQLLSSSGGRLNPKEIAQCNVAFELLTSVVHLSTCHKATARPKVRHIGHLFAFFAAIILSQMIDGLSCPPHSLRYRRTMIPGVCQLKWNFFGGFRWRSTSPTGKIDKREKLKQQ